MSFSLISIVCSWIFLLVIKRVFWASLISTHFTLHVWSKEFFSYSISQSSFFHSYRLILMIYASLMIHLESSNSSAFSLMIFSKSYSFYFQSSDNDLTLSISFSYTLIVLIISELLSSSCLTFVSCFKLRFVKAVYN